ncbi:MAG: uroporphyrinogen decarboxylase family protein [Christensenellales bacterium]
MNMKNWFAQQIASPKKKAMPILSFPSISLLDVSVRELISSSDVQAKGMHAIAERCDTLAAVSLMDLSLEAEAFGAQIRTDDGEVPTVIGTVIKSPEDAENLKVPQVGQGRTGIYIEAIEKAVKLIDDRPVFAGAIGPFSLSGRLMDMTEIMVNCYIEPEMVKNTLEKASDFLIEYIKAYRQTGASGVVMAEPAAGLLSPDLIAEFSTPYVKKISDAVRSDDFCFIYHNCGNTVPLLSSIFTIDADGYHFGNAIDMEKILEQAPKDKPIFGNVDPAGQFRNGTPQSIYDVTTSLLERCCKYPNFIISSGCDIPPLASWENIDSFFKAVSDFYK